LGGYAVSQVLELIGSGKTLLCWPTNADIFVYQGYSHIRLDAKRSALEAIANPVSEAGVAQKWAQSPTTEKTTVTNW